MENQPPSPPQKILNLLDYEGMTKVWKPQQNGDQALFLVRIPSDCTTLTESEYIDLMKLRVAWMMQHWLKYEDDDPQQLQTHMSSALLQLHSGQVEPRLHDSKGEAECFEGWASDWANCLIECNARWQEWFYVTNSEVSFPAEVDTCDLISSESHDEISIEQFFSDLRAPFE